jgi:hypothetical protein
MNALYWIAFGLFAITFYAILEHNILATILGFTTSIIVAVLAVHVDDLNKKR